MRREMCCALLLAINLCGCAATQGIRGAHNSSNAAIEEEEEEASAGAIGFLWGVAMYLPNRVRDLFDVVRFGINLGPGFGVQAKATEFVQAVAISRLSVGVGLQGLRHLPVYASGEGALGVGPLTADATAGLGWFQSWTDFRLELHALLAGAHVAVDPVEIVDFVLGFVVIDIREDDL